MLDRVQFVNEMKKALDLPDSYRIDIDEPIFPVTAEEILYSHGFDLGLGWQVFHFNLRNNPDLSEQILKVDIIPAIIRSNVISLISEEKERLRVEEERKKAEAKGAFSVKGVTFKMVRVEGGTFMMGSTSGCKDQEPVHKVQVNSFYIGQTEVTQELWKTVMGWNPSFFKGDKKPVEQVTWDDCQQFIRKLNLLTGKKFRLPTEAEWEFAARGGTQSKGYIYSGSNNMRIVAWCKGNDGGTTHDVATKVPNELGIYDMSGNVFEWCQDWYGPYNDSLGTNNNPIGPSSGDCRVARGGCWNADDYAGNLRVSYRYYCFPYVERKFLGLRIAL